MKRQRPIIATPESWTLLSQGLMITALTPTQVINATLDHVDVTFNEAINPTTFTTNDVSLTGPPDVGSESVPDAVVIQEGGKKGKGTSLISTVREGKEPQGHARKRLEQAA
jgi:hypothetical protein